MTSAKGYYSLIQYCPDLARMETANVGVLLFCPDRAFLKARLARDNAKLRRAFGLRGNALVRIRSYKLALQERIDVERSRIRTVDDLRRFIARRANDFQMTPPRFVKVRDPETQLAALFEQLVGGGRRRESLTALQERLDRLFESASVSHKLRRNLSIVVPVVERQIRIPYAYHNGRLELIKPLQFVRGDHNRAIDVACKYAVEGRALSQHPNEQLGPMRLNVVVRIEEDSDRKTENVLQTIFAEYSVGFYPERDVSRLIDDIRRTGAARSSNM